MDPNDPSTWPASAREFYFRRLGIPQQTPLTELLAEEIRHSGPIPFARFMEQALYHPTLGYYTRERNPVGRAGDFVTAPDHHPAFGRLVGRRTAQVLSQLPRPRRVVEMGAGNGTLAHGILTELAERQVALDQYRIIEPFAVWRGRQQTRLQPWAEKMEWRESLEEQEPFSGVFVSNELPDAFPVHRVVYRNGALRELRVTRHGDRFAEEEGDLSTPALAEYFQRLGLTPPEGQGVAVNLALEPWARQVASRLARGSFLTLDYGATAAELYSGNPPKPGLRAYAGHAAADPLEQPGERDITAEVDFSTLIRAGEEAGLTLHAFTTQREFLLAMGWEEWRKSGPEGGRRALLDLIDPDLMGNTRVLELIRA